MVVPEANAQEAELVPELTVLSAESLQHLVEQLRENHCHKAKRKRPRRLQHAFSSKSQRQTGEKRSASGLLPAP